MAMHEMMGCKPGTKKEVPVRGPPRISKGNKVKFDSPNLKRALRHSRLARLGDTLNPLFEPELREISGRRRLGRETLLFRGRLEKL